MLREEYFPNVSSALILGITSLVVYYYCCYKLSYWKRSGVQQLNDTSKIFGDFKDGVLFRSPPAIHLSDIYRRSPPGAPFVGFYIFHKPCLLLKDPEIIKQIFLRDSDKFTDRYFAGSQQKDSSGMINLFGLKNPAWRYLRKKMTPSFTLSKLKQMFEFMSDSKEPLMKYLEKNIDDDTQVRVLEVQDACYRYTADLIANVVLGSKTDSFADTDYSKYFMDYFHSLKRMVAILTVFFVPQFVTIIGSPILYDFSYFRKIFWHAFESREKSGGKRGDFLDTLIQLKNEEQDPVFKFEGDNLIAQTGIFLAGLETSSIVTAFTLMELAINKECQDGARECIRNAISKHGWTIEGFHDMKYLEQCIAEGLRLYPPVSTLDREALYDYQIPNTDIIIKAGTPVYISLFGTHRDARFFDRPEVFDPARFNSDKIIPDNYLPFGIGPKHCIAARTGQLYMKVVIATILLKYQLYHPRPQTGDLDLDKRATFTIAADGINIEFTKLN